MDKKLFNNIEFKAIEENGFRATITKNVIDRDKEVVIPLGVNTKEYLKNPVILWDHNSNIPSIGKTKKLIKHKDSIEVEGEFATTDFAQDIYKLVKGGYLNSLSIGFKVVEDRQPSKKDIIDYGKGINRVISKSELVEYSFVNLPANSEAIVSAVKNKSISLNSANIICPEIKIAEEKREKIKIEYEVDMTDSIIKEESHIAELKRRGRLYY